MTKKLIITEANVESVNATLEGFGYRTSLGLIGDFQSGELGEVGQWVNLRYQHYKGFYISVSGGWLEDSDTIDQFAEEFQSAKMLYKVLEVQILMAEA